MIDKDYLEPINDITGISWRLKEIDVGYRLMYNKLSHRVEVHNVNNVGDTLSLVCPFEKIDSRLLTLARQTRKERSEEIAREIEQQNKKIEEENYNKIVDNAIARAKDVVGRADDGSPKVFDGIDNLAGLCNVNTKQISNSLRQEGGDSKQISNALRQDAGDTKQINNSLRQEGGDTKQISNSLRQDGGDTKQISNALRQDGGEISCGVNNQQNNVLSALLEDDKKIDGNADCTKFQNKEI